MEKENGVKSEALNQTMVFPDIIPDLDPIPIQLEEAGSS